jgi:hypothetical protein
MKLAAISGVNGVFSDADIAKVVTLAKKARLTWKKDGGAKAAAPRKRAAAPKVAAPAPVKAAARKAAPRKASAKIAKAPAKAAPAKNAPAKAAAPAKRLSAPSRMNKSDLIDVPAKQARISKATAADKPATRRKAAA